MTSWPEGGMVAEKMILILKKQREKKKTGYYSILIVFSVCILPPVICPNHNNISVREVQEIPDLFSSRKTGFSLSRDISAPSRSLRLFISSKLLHIIWQDGSYEEIPVIEHIGCVTCAPTKYGPHSLSVILCGLYCLKNSIFRLYEFKHLLNAIVVIR